MRKRVAEARLRAALSANRELVLLYWSIGQDILAGKSSEPQDLDTLMGVVGPCLQTYLCASSPTFCPLGLIRDRGVTTSAKSKNLAPSLWQGADYCCYLGNQTVEDGPNPCEEGQRLVEAYER